MSQFWLGTLMEINRKTWARWHYNITMDLKDVSLDVWIAFIWLGVGASGGVL